jgi:multicomponent Na+:H+ antiporter subunit E
MSRYRRNILLAVIWAALTGSFTPANFVLGLALGWVALFLVREQLERRRGRYRVKRILSLAGLFIKELILSGWRVARLVTSPRMELRPGIFAYPLRLQGNFEITVLANLITLTPGTLSVDVSDDRKTLFVHAIDCSDVDKTVREIREGFERRIGEAFSA